MLRKWQIIIINILAFHEFIIVFWEYLNWVYKLRWYLCYGLDWWYTWKKKQKIVSMCRNCSNKLRIIIKFVVACAKQIIELQLSITEHLQ